MIDAKVWSLNAAQSSHSMCTIDSVGHYPIGSLFQYFYGMSSFPQQEEMACVRNILMRQNKVNRLESFPTRGQRRILYSLRSFNKYPSAKANTNRYKSSFIP